MKTLKRKLTIQGFVLSISLLFFLLNLSTLAQNDYCNVSNRLGQSPIHSDPLKRIWITPVAGYNFASLRYTEESLQAHKSELFMLPVLGLEIHYQLNDQWNFEPSVLMIEKGQKIEDEFDYELRSEYTELRFLMAYRIYNPGKLELYMRAGPSLAFCRGGEIKYNNETLTLTKGNSRSTDIGINLGLVTRMPLIKEKKVYISFAANYGMGLSDTYSKSEQDGNAIAINALTYQIDGKRTNRGLDITFSLSFSLSNFTGMFKPNVVPYN